MTEQERANVIENLEALISREAQSMGDTCDLWRENVLENARELLEYVRETPANAISFDGRDSVMYAYLTAMLEGAAARFDNCQAAPPGLSPVVKWGLGLGVVGVVAWLVFGRKR